MYLEIFLADFAVFHVFLGISRDFAEIPEFRGSATARNIRSPEKRKGVNDYIIDKINIKPFLLKEQKAQEGFLLLIYGLDSVWYLRLILFTKSGKSRDLLHLIWILIIN